jgi:hypothetical protein
LSPDDDDARTPTTEELLRPRLLKGTTTVRLGCSNCIIRAACRRDDDDDDDDVEHAKLIAKREDEDEDDINERDVTVAIVIILPFFLAS